MTDAIMCRIQKFRWPESGREFYGPALVFHSKPTLVCKKNLETNPGATIGIDIDDLEGMIDRAVRREY